MAAADIDLSRTTEFRKLFPKARVYQDFRELLEKEADLQTVNVSTPDHMHARIGLRRPGPRRECSYGQKPLTHDLAETRRLTELAREKKAVTQMGIQIHSSTGSTRTAVETWCRMQCAIGKIKRGPHVEQQGVGRHRREARSQPIRYPRVSTGTPGWVFVPSGPFHRPGLGTIRATGGSGSISAPAHLRRYGLPHLRPGLLQALALTAPVQCAQRRRRAE